MDVVGEHVVARDQRRQALLQALERQAVGGVDARRAQDGDGDAGPPPPAAQHALGVDAAAGAGAFRLRAPRLVDGFGAAIAVDPRGANVNQAPW